MNNRVIIRIQSKKYTQMNEKKFDPKKLQKLNNPQRLLDIPPDYIWEKLGLEASGVFVEIGAGTAFFSLAFLQRYQPEKVYACDLSEEMLDWVEKNVSSKYPDIIPVKTGENSVPLDNEIAALVLMINLHHELDDPSLSLGEAYRLLKSGGQICIVDWKKQDMPEGPPEIIRCLPAEVKEQMECAGFREVNIYNDLQKHFVIIGKKAENG
jgi:ubiquinone/menaquinone biosynthesis C-methylase UbiE